MAPPKRKTSGGRITPKGTRPGQAPASGTPASAASTAGTSGASGSVASSSRYTPPNPRNFDESPRWVPILMAALFAIAFALILLRYLVWDNTNLPVVIGLGFLLAGLFTATRWR